MENKWTAPCVSKRFKEGAFRIVSVALSSAATKVLGSSEEAKAVLG